MTDAGFGARSVTSSTEHGRLLSKEIHDMDLDKIIILPERQNPILVSRIKHYGSAEFLEIHMAPQDQTDPFPAANPSDTTTR